MAWVWLIVAGLFEVAWAISLKHSEGFTRLWPTVAMLVAMGFSLVCFGFAMRDLPIGTAYAVWTGIGAVGAVLYGLWAFGESSDPLRLVCIALILAGIVGLKLAGE